MVIHLKRIDEESKRVAFNFRRLRKLNKWTQEDLAKKFISPQTKRPVTWGYIGHIESCEVRLGYKNRQKFAEIFECDVSEFTQPIAETDLDQEIELLKNDARKWGIENIKRLREMGRMAFSSMEEINAPRKARSKKKKASP